MRFNGKQIVFLFGMFFCISMPASAQWLNKGYLKYGFSHVRFTDQAQMFSNYDQLAFQNLSSRLMTEYSGSSVTAALHYDLRYHFSHQQIPRPDIDSDSGNYFDMTDVLAQDESQQFLHRVDRLYLHYRGEQLSAKLGRQAVSWGHGLFFQVIDIVSPFSPVELDTDYKTGTDMFYAEWLFERGDDVQTVFIPVRDVNNELDVKGGIYAGKMHALVYDTDIDLVMAANRRSEMIGFGLARPMSKTMWRFDASMQREVSGDSRLSFVTNIDYSWVLAKHNFYGFAEYLYDNLGQRSQGGMSLTGNHYAALGLRIELHPLLNVAPSVINNLEDSSGLLYIVVAYDWMQDMNVQTSFAIPFGSSDSDFGGVRSPGHSLRILLNAYF